MRWASIFSSHCFRGRLGAALWVFLLGSPCALAAGTLDFYLINVDHGNAVLVVTPAGQSMLLDAGPPGKVYVDRILAAIADAGVKQIGRRE